MGIFDRDRSAERLPVSLITGFLGSGKTTLLNRLLKQPEMGDSAVIINEFGEIGLDHLFVESVSGEIKVMRSGCICCTVLSDLDQTLRDLLARRQEGSVPSFGRILIETTGLADPAPIMQSLFANPLLVHRLRLDCVIATVDCVHGAMQLDMQPEALKQAALADRLLLTKADIAGQAAVDALAARLARLNPGAPRHLVRHGEIGKDRLFAGPGPDGERRIRELARWFPVPAHAHGHDGHDHGGDVNRHDARIRAHCLTAEAPLDWQSCNEWLRLLRDLHGAELLRVKGVLALRGESGPVIVHGVHHVFHPPVALSDWPTADRRSRLVIIARDLDGVELARSWQALAEPAATLP
ncbi:MAG: GTP-binding protein [Alphaproteobacteria bacterium]|nr:GTP-binding protein [Alphaproteobacteria bacterium]